jgi:hypothetical protein
MQEHHLSERDGLSKVKYRLASSGLLVFVIDVEEESCADGV